MAPSMTARKQSPWRRGGGAQQSCRRGGSRHARRARSPTGRVKLCSASFGAVAHGSHSVQLYSAPAAKRRTGPSGGAVRMALATRTAATTARQLQLAAVAAGRDCSACIRRRARGQPGSVAYSRAACPPARRVRSLGVCCAPSLGLNAAEEGECRPNFGPAVVGESLDRIARHGRARQDQRRCVPW